MSDQRQFSRGLVVVGAQAKGSRTPRVDPCDGPRLPGKASPRNCCRSWVLRGGRGLPGEEGEQEGAAQEALAHAEKGPELQEGRGLRFRERRVDLAVAQ